MKEHLQEKKEIISLHKEDLYLQLGGLMDEVHYERDGNPNLENLSTKEDDSEERTLKVIFQLRYTFPLV